MVQEQPITGSTHLEPPPEAAREGFLGETAQGAWKMGAILFPNSSAGRLEFKLLHVLSPQVYSWGRWDQGTVRKLRVKNGDLRSKVTGL
jgi:hypothetical protein